MQEMQCTTYAYEYTYTRDKVINVKNDDGSCFKPDDQPMPEHGLSKLQSPMHKPKAALLQY